MSRREHARLARSRAGKDEQRASAEPDRLALSRIELRVKVL
jgi:hypothetical protein